MMDITEMVTHLVVNCEEGWSGLTVLCWVAAHDGHDRGCEASCRVLSRGLKWTDCAVLGCS